MMEGVVAPARTEQRQPTGTRILGRPFLQLEADIAAGETGDHTAVARRHVLEWLQRKSGVDIPAAAWSGNSFILRSGQGRIVEAIAHDSPFLWATLLIAPEAAVAGRSWIAETALRQDADRLRLVIRLGYAAPNDIGDIVIAVPPFVRQLLRDLPLRSGTLALSDTAMDVADELAVEELARLIESDQRQVPIIVVSEADSAGGSRYLLDTRQLAANLAGLAVVYRLPYELGYHLTDLFGKSWSVFNGACRTYWPGFSRVAQTPYDHPLILGHRLVGDEHAAWGLETLCQAVARASVANPAIFQRLPRFHDLKADLVRREANEQDAADSAAPPRASLLEQQLEVMKDQVEQSLSQAVAAEQDARQAREDLAESRRLNAALHARIEALQQAALDGMPQPPVAPRPVSYAELPAWAEENFPDRLVLSPKARRGLAASVYKDRALVCDALELLAEHYVAMRRNGGRDDFEERLRALKLKDEAVSATPAKLRNDPQYWCRHEGRALFTDRHLKKGNSRDPQECMRIYYAWDETSRQVVIGHMTTHLETSIS